MATSVIALLIVSCNPQREPGTGPPPDAVPEIHGPGSTQVDTLPNMSTPLSQLYAEWRAGKSIEQTAETFGLEIKEDRVFVTLIMLDEPSAQEAISALRELGAEVTSSYDTWIDAWVPIAELENVAALPGISLVREVVLVLPIDQVPEEKTP